MAEPLIAPRHAVVVAAWDKLPTIAVTYACGHKGRFVDLPTTNVAALEAMRCPDCWAADMERLLGGCQ